MRKVFVLAPSEDWIVDRFVKEWRADNPDISTLDPEQADVIWLMADWCRTQLPRNVLYQCLNLYPITARQEGGPQSLIECGLLGVPAVSRDIGMASQVLPASAISDDVTSATPTVPDVSALSLPNGYAAYRKLLEIL